MRIKISSYIMNRTCRTVKRNNLWYCSFYWAIWIVCCIAKPVTNAESMCAGSNDCISCILAHIISSVVYIKARTCCYGDCLWTTRSKGERSICCYVVSTGNIIVAHNFDFNQLAALYIFVICARNEAKIRSFMIKVECIITTRFTACSDSAISGFACMVKVVWGRLCLSCLYLYLWLRSCHSHVCI